MRAIKLMRNPVNGQILVLLMEGNAQAVSVEFRQIKTGDGIAPIVKLGPEECQAIADNLAGYGFIGKDKGRKPDHPNYPTKTPEQLRIETLERENDAAFEKIVRLSRALADFGIDPTQLP